MAVCRSWLIGRINKINRGSPCKKNLIATGVTTKSVEELFFLNRNLIATEVATKPEVAYRAMCIAIRCIRF